MGFFKKSEEEHHDLVFEEMRAKVAEASLPSHAVKIADKELNLLQRMGSSTSEYTISLAYLEYLTSLPWNTKTDDNLDIERAEKILNEEHYGLHKVKERILEHLAVKKLKAERKARVLVVDDEEIARKNLSYALEKENYVVTAASGGADAVHQLEMSSFDVILTDLKMANIDGMEILKRAKTKYPDTEVIMMTGYATIDNAVEAMKRGAFHYVAKPFKLDDVRKLIKDALEKKSLKKETKGSVLCFAGPPGTGKTSMGRAVAKALGRKFARISLGGVRDEAEIRGHRRTYAGAMPGRIIEEIRRAGSSNPVLILDEVDKIGQDFKGDPAAALLEVLDPEQNTNFTDHYLDIPFDLSNVIFIITANIAENIIEVLRNRMEVIQFSGYTEEEKAAIASQFLIPKEIREAGLADAHPQFTSDAIYKIIQEYTYEAGIRNLDREIAKICRKTAKKHVQHYESSYNITPHEVERLLGPRRYYFETADEGKRIGITTGLVWTEAGGDIIFVEAAKMKGKQKLMLTGSLGEVMRESAQTALSFVRSKSELFGIPENFFEHNDIHIHVPAGAIPKDGPSAGAAIALSLISLLTGRPAKKNVAVTGELTLSGSLLPVAGIKEKILAAKKSRTKTVILPIKNKIDADDILAEVKNGPEIFFADKIEEIVDMVLV
jgi:ATP-dependent Lon protease